jgi:hypothetical protein
VTIDTWRKNATDSYRRIATIAIVMNTDDAAQRNRTNSTAFSRIRIARS